MTGCQPLVNDIHATKNTLIYDKKNMASLSSSSITNWTCSTILVRHMIDLSNLYGGYVCKQLELNLYKLDLSYVRLLKTNQIYINSTSISSCKRVELNFNYL
jgi:hypothetical protein